MIGRGMHRLVRVLKYTVIGGAVGSSLLVVYKNHWDVSTVGLLRFGRAAFVAMVIVADYKQTLAGLDDSSDKYKQLISEVHLRSAHRLRTMCCTNGGCFIKVGQHIGALDYLLPSEYVNTMKVLHSQAPQSSLEDVRGVITRELGEVDKLFVDFEPRPVGAASLAQVHRARLRDGTRVAVKVQHPRVREHTFVDMKTMELLVHIAQWIFPNFKFAWLAEETKRSLPIELDFEHEGRNCEKVHSMFAHLKFLKVPRVYWNLSTKAVLTMEYCEGEQVNDLKYMRDNNISHEQVSMQLGELYSEMIFVRGYIHCDPHPGNILVKKMADGSPQIVLLDHGLYQTLTDEFRLNYCHLWLALLHSDETAIKHYAQLLGSGDLHRVFACMVTGRSWKSVVEGLHKINTTQALEQEDTEVQQQAGDYIPEITEILSRMPSAMRLILKTNDLLRGIDCTLGTRAHVTAFMPMSACCVRAVHADMRARSTSRAAVLRAHVREQIALFSITLYRTYLWLSSSLLRAVHSWWFTRVT